MLANKKNTGQHNFLGSYFGCYKNDLGFVSGCSVYFQVLDDRPEARQKRCCWPIQLFGIILWGLQDRFGLCFWVLGVLSNARRPPRCSPKRFCGPVQFWGIIIWRPQTPLGLCFSVLSVLSSARRPSQCSPKKYWPEQFWGVIFWGRQYRFDGTAR